MRIPNPIRSLRRYLAFRSDFRRLGAEAQQKYGASVSQMRKEFMSLRDANGLGRHEYFYFGLFDPSLPWERKREYIGNALLRRLWSALNPIEYRYIFKNKLVFDQVCRSAGLPSPPFVAVFDPDHGRTADGRPLRTVAEIEEWIRTGTDGDIVMKPAEGAEGKMVRAFKGKRLDPAPALIALDDTPVTAQELHDFLTDAERLREACEGPETNACILIQRRVRNHPALARLAPHTLNTLRLVTLQDRGIEPAIIAATLKLQTGTSGMDNLHWGSLVISVDMESGFLKTAWTVAPDAYRGRFEQLPPLERMETAPTSGIRFADVRIPMWNEAKQTALRAAAAFPYVRAIGWDVAVTPDGPCIIEGNWAWGGAIAQGGSGRGLYHGNFKRICDRLREEGKADQALV